MDTETVSSFKNSPCASLLVPCFNEEEALPMLLKLVRGVFTEKFGDDWELVLVDDGSRDRTPQIIHAEAARDKRIKGVLLSRNFGHQAALSAGLRFCRGRSVGIIDCDLQDPIEVLVELYRKVEEEGYDVAYGIRRKRQAPLLLKFAYKIFYKLMRGMSEHDWPVDAGDFCVMTGRCAGIINGLPENVRMIRGIRSWIGFRQIGVPYTRPRRVAGRSHYNLARLSRLALDAMVGFSTVPLRLASITGFVTGLVSLGFAMIFLLNRLVPEIFPFGYKIGVSPGIATLAVLVSFLGSVILICIGILGEYIAILLREVKGRPSAIVAQVTGAESDDGASGSASPAVPASSEPVVTTNASSTPRPYR